MPTSSIRCRRRWSTSWRSPAQTRMIVTARRRHRAAGRSRRLWDDELLPPHRHRNQILPQRIPARSTHFWRSCPTPVRDVLDYLAVQEPIPLADLATPDVGRGGARGRTPRRGGGASTADERRRWCSPRIRCSPSGPGPRSATTAPDGCAPDWCRWRRAGAATTPATGCGWRSWRSAATPRSRSTDVVAAASEALRLGDLALAERLARAALERSDALAARLLLAHALAWQGRGREADAGARRGGSRRAVRTGADGLGTAAGGQPVLDARPARAGDGVPAHHPRAGSPNRRRRPPSTRCRRRSR